MRISDWSSDVCSSDLGGHLVLRGLAPHQGGEEEAIVLIKIFDGTLRAALLHEGRMRLFAPDAEYRYLPPPLKEFVRPRDDTFYPSAPPPGVEWLSDPRGCGGHHGGIVRAIGRTPGRQRRWQ